MRALGKLEQTRKTNGHVFFAVGKRVTKCLENESMPRALSFFSFEKFGSEGTEGKKKQRIWKNGLRVSAICTFPNGLDCFHPAIPVPRLKPEPFNVVSFDVYNTHTHTHTPRGHRPPSRTLTP